MIETFKKERKKKIIKMVAKVNAELLAKHVIEELGI